MTFEVKSVVVVDDDGDVRENLQEILEREGFNVFAAKDGCEALKLIEQCRGRCLIVLDLLMPEMDGWEFLERQLAFPGAGSGRPIVVVSGAMDAPRALKMPGVVAVLMKPFELSEFVATVREHCQPI